MKYNLESSFSHIISPERLDMVSKDLDVDYEGLLGIADENLNSRRNKNENGNGINRFFIKLAIILILLKIARNLISQRKEHFRKLTQQKNLL